MHGNVWEWCNDSMYDYSENNEVVVNPVGKGTDLYALRGGCFM